MPDKRKINENELNSVRKIKNERDDLYYKMGVLEHRIQLHEDSIEELREEKKKFLNEIHDLEDQSRKVGKRLTKKYGSNRVDLDTGEITDDS